MDIECKDKVVRQFVMNSFNQAHHTLIIKCECCGKLIQSYYPEVAAMNHTCTIREIIDLEADKVEVKQ